MQLGEKLIIADIMHAIVSLHESCEYLWSVRFQVICWNLLIDTISQLRSQIRIQLKTK
jgi:hypothetical protein